MRDDLEKLKQIKFAMVSCALDLEMLSKEIFIVQHSFMSYREAEQELIENISFLKRAKIIVVAKEYARLNKELKFARDQIANLSKKYSVLAQQFNKLELRHSELADAYDKQYDLCESYNSLVEFKRK